MRPDNLTYLVARVHRQLHNRLEERLRQFDLSVEQWRVLDELARRDGMSMGELAAFVLMNHPALTKMTDRMVANGLVHRAPDSADQRRVLVFLTDRGHALYDRIASAVGACETELKDMIGGANYKALQALMENFRIVAAQ